MTTNINKIVITIDNCMGCEYCEHNGLLQCSPKWICRHYDVSKKCKELPINYWYYYPILGDVGKKESIPIPDWCPRLLKEGE